MYAELLIDQGSGPLNQAQLDDVAVILENTHDIERTLRSYLDIEEERWGFSRAEPSSVNLVVILGQIRERLLPAFAKQALHLIGPGTSKSLWVITDPIRLTRALENILLEASRYAAPGEGVRLEVNSFGATACILVAVSRHESNRVSLENVEDIHLSDSSRGGVAEQESAGFTMDAVEAVIQVLGGRFRFEQDTERFLVELPAATLAEQGARATSLEHEGSGSPWASDTNPRL